MAFTRKFLKALGIAEEAVDSIMDAHTEVTNALIAERDAAKAAAPDVTKLNQQLEDLKKKVDTAKAEGKAEVQVEFDRYKNGIEAEKLNATKKTAVMADLKENGVQRDDFVNLLLGQVDMTKVEVDENNKVKDNSFINDLKVRYPGCFGNVEQRGAGANNPPPGGSQKMTKEEFFKKPLHEQMAYANEHPAEWAEYNKKE